MRVLTLNVWGRRGDWAARREVLVGGLRELRPDLVAFVEAIKTEEYDQVVDLLGSDFHVAHQTEREPDGQGASIASRWPISGLHEVDLHVTPRTADFACVTLVAEIAASEPYGQLVFVDHVPNWQLRFEHERELQALAAARFVEELADDRHVVFAGDFTADPDSAGVRFLTGRQSLDGTSVCYRDAWESVHPGEPGETFTPRNPLVYDWDWPFRRLDYILVRCGEHGGPTLTISSCERIFDEPVDGVWASDHFGVVADLRAAAALMVTRRSRGTVNGERVDEKGSGRGFNGWDLVVIVFGIAFAWGLAGRHHYSVASIIFACVITGFALTGFARRLLRLRVSRGSRSRA